MEPVIRRVSMNLPAGLVDQLEEYASAQRRNMTSQLTCILEDFFDDANKAYGVADDAPGEAV